VANGSIPLPDLVALRVPGQRRHMRKGLARPESGDRLEPQPLLAASPSRLAKALRAGAWSPSSERDVSRTSPRRVTDNFGGDLAAALVGPARRARKILKTFSWHRRSRCRPHIAVELASPPSRPFRPIVRTSSCESSTGQRATTTVRTYREAQQAIEAEVPGTFEARTRAYLLLKRHGQELCKRTKPKCPGMSGERCLRLFRQQPPRAVISPVSTLVNEGNEPPLASLRESSVAAPHGST